MNVFALFHSASARFEEKIYGIQVGLSVYVGLVRSSLQEKIPFLSHHLWAAVGISLFVVVGIQSVILVLSLLSAFLSFLGSIPSAFRRLIDPPVRVIHPLPSPPLSE